MQPLAKLLALLLIRARDFILPSALLRLPIRAYPIGKRGQRGHEVLSDADRRLVNLDAGFLMKVTEHRVSRCFELSTYFGGAGLQECRTLPYCGLGLFGE